MKHGKKPNKQQKVAIIAARLDPVQWLIVKNLSGQLHIVHRNTKKLKVIPA